MFARTMHALALTAAAAALLLTGCGTAGPATQHHGGGAQTIVKRDASNGSTVRVSVGDKLELILGSSYWNFRGSSAPGILRQMGPAELLKTKRTCVPGGGCQPKRVIYRAVKPGRVVITAHRVSCGEALACTGSKGSFKLTVIVG